MLSIVLLFVFGLLVGSFLSSLTYRYPREEKVSSGRSFCPICKKTIAWHDNIPLLSYIVLKGRCRNCDDKISLRYPLIELSTALSFVFVGWFLVTGNAYYIGHFWTLPYLLFLFTVLIAIFVIDLEHKIIPDSLVYSIFIATLVVLFITSTPLYPHLLAAFGAATFLLLLHLLTGGRGMGLGDVKFALAGGLILANLVIVWMFISFLLGAIVGLLLIVLGKAKFGKEIPFGPFLIIGLIVAMFFGTTIQNVLLPGF